MNAQVRRLVLGSSVVVLVVGLAGCGGQASPQAGGQTSAPATTAAATPTPTPTPTPTTVIELTAANLADLVAKAGATAKTCTFTMEATEGTDQMSAEGAVRIAADGSGEWTMQATVPEGSLEYRVVAGTWYVNAGAATNNLFITGDPADPEGPFAGMESVFDSISPNTGFAGFAGGVVSVTPVGKTELMGGVPTQAYDIVIDTTKLTDKVRSEQFDDTTPLPTQVTFRYWFGADALVRRIEADIQGQKQTMTFAHWGEPVEIKAPTADQILDLG